MADNVFSDKMAGPVNEPPSPATACPKSQSRYASERGAIRRGGSVVGLLRNHQLSPNLTSQPDGLQNFGSVI
jgi:hypothetical protein